jgi:hypothetical protein
LLNVVYKPIQLLRPPGLCRLVWPIFTDSYSFSVLILSDPFRRKCSPNGSALSMIGLLGNPFILGIGDEGPLAGCSNKSSVLTVRFGMDKNDSACHSYHTCLSLVSLQMQTRSSESLGRYSGS